MPHEGTCRLCLRHGELRDSHLLPRSMYKLLRNIDFPNPNPIVYGQETAIPTSKQVKQYLLCGECEQRFSNRGEAWVMAHCWRGVGKFRIQEILVQSTPLIENDELKVFAGATIADLDMDKLVYFGASVFWRASVCEWKLMAERVHIRLGDYGEELRQYLLDEAPFPRNIVLNIGVSALTGTLDVALLPKSSRTKIGIHRHRFIIPGIYFTLLVGSRITDNERLLCAAHSAGRHISIWQQTEPEFLSGTAKKIFQTMRHLRK